jgi:hypothetical protein
VTADEVDGPVVGEGDGAWAAISQPSEIAVCHAMAGGAEFHDNGESYLAFPRDSAQRHAFEAGFLRKTG